jgi:hypothetical protein
LLCQVLAETVKKHGFAFQPDPGGPAEQACHASKLQAAFYERRLAEGTARQQRDKRWRAYTRALRAATEAGLVGVREIDSDRFCGRGDDFCSHYRPSGGLQYPPRKGGTGPSVDI